MLDQGRLKSVGDEVRIRHGFQAGGNPAKLTPTVRSSSIRMARKRKATFPMDNSLSMHGIAFAKTSGYTPVRNKPVTPVNLLLLDQACLVGPRKPPEPTNSSSWGTLEEACL